MLRADNEAKSRMLQDYILRERSGSLPSAGPSAQAPQTSLAPAPAANDSTGIKKMIGRTSITSKDGQSVSQLQESNRKLQLAVEEAMMKNMQYKVLIIR